MTAPVNETSLQLDAGPGAAGIDHDRGLAQHVGSHTGNETELQAHYCVARLGLHQPQGWVLPLLQGGERAARGSARSPLLPSPGGWILEPLGSPHCTPLLTPQDEAVCPWRSEQTFMFLCNYSRAPAAG